MVNENNGPARSARKMALIAGMLVVLVAIILLVLWIFAPEPSVEPKIMTPGLPQETLPELAPEPEPEPESEPEPEPYTPQEATPALEPEVPLPPLGESDETVHEDVEQLRGGSQLSGLLVTDDLIRKVVRAVTAAQEGGLVHTYRPVKSLEAEFEAEPAGGATDDELPRYRLTEASYRRYDALINLLNSLDAGSLVAIYRHYYPLLKQAYEEQGLVDNGTFHEVTLAAIDILLAAPVIEDDILLVQPSVMYRYVDPELEALPSVHKMMLRMGPDNSRKLKGVLRRLKAEMEDQGVDSQ